MTKFMDLELESILDEIERHELPFYVERNHHWQEGMSLKGGLLTLYRINKIDHDTMNQCLESGSLWYVRMYVEGGYLEHWGSSFDSVIRGLHCELEKRSEAHEAH